MLVEPPGTPKAMCRTGAAERHRRESYRVSIAINMGADLQQRHLHLLTKYIFLKFDCNFSLEFSFLADSNDL